MKAAVMTALKAPLVVQEVADPTPGPGDAVITVAACGICRSDWHVWQGDWHWSGVRVSVPRIMGHEMAGVVTAVGPAVTRFQVGDRVTLPFHTACGRCEHCQSGRSNLCTAGDGVVGLHFDGGFAEQVRVPRADVNLVALPDDVDFVGAAALGCRYMTAFHGLVDRARLRPGEWVAVFGVGGVGLSAVQIAAALGGRVVAVDIDDARLAQARSEGAVATLNAAVDRLPRAIKSVTDGGAHLTVDALGASATAVPAIRSVRRGGRHLQLGLTGQVDQGALALPTDNMIFQEIDFLTSYGCPSSSYEALLALVALGRLRPDRLVTATVSLAETGDHLAAMSDFATRGLHILTPA